MLRDLCEGFEKAVDHRDKQSGKCKAGRDEVEASPIGMLWKAKGA